MIIATKDYLIEQLIHDPNYRIYKNGKIKTLITIAGNVSVKKQWRYCCYTHNSGGILIRYKHKRLLLHRILFRKFIGNLDSKKVINHKDHDSYNNSLNNLEIISASENQVHRYTKSESLPIPRNAKINFSIAEEIRQLYKNKQMSYSKLTKKFSLSKSTISYIIQKKIWVKPYNEIQHFHQGAKVRKISKPTWVKMEDLSNFYRNKPKSCVVDHIIPTIHPDVCGLHVPWNLQYLSKKDNNLKSNKFDYTMNNDSWKKTKNSKKRSKSKF